MNLVQILLPLFGSDGKRIASSRFVEVREELTDRFGGVTAYTRAPAKGTWRKGKTTVRDDIVVLEIMVKYLDRKWWSNFRRKLEKRFKQTRIVIRTSKVKTL